MRVVDPHRTTTDGDESDDEPDDTDGDASTTSIDDDDEPETIDDPVLPPNFGLGVEHPRCNVGDGGSPWPALVLVVLAHRRRRARAVS